ncbi:hypothetical protein [Gordonia malaquae]|uniref:hypothetical protein n=1 Tax=Gordonia malaquae TaxID=410332 RepID=UPI00301AAA62
MTERKREFAALIRERFDHWTKVLRLPTKLAIVDRSRIRLDDPSSTWVAGEYEAWSNKLTIDLGAALLPFTLRRLDDREAMRTYVDGLLLHELGHRRDRWRIAPHLAVTYLGSGLIAAVFLVSFFMGSAWWMLPAVAGIFIVMVIAGAVLAQKVAVRVPRRARFEVRADDFACDIGGAEVIDELLWSMETYPRVDLMDGVYQPVAERRARQWERATGGGIPADRTGEWRQAPAESA